MNRRRWAAAAALVGSLCVSLSAHAQLNLVGYWDPIFHEDVEERIPGPSIGDYLGLPISDAARWRAESWDASLLSLPEHQCKPHPSTYGFRGVGTLRMWEERDPQSQDLVKIHTHIQWQARKLSSMVQATGQMRKASPWSTCPPEPQQLWWSKQDLV